MTCAASRSQNSAHGQGSQKREEHAKTGDLQHLPWHVFINWEMFPIGNACWDSYRGINLPPRAHLCTWVHVHAHISYPKRRFLLHSCTERCGIARTAHSSFALCPSWEIAFPSALKPCQSCSTQVCQPLNFLWLALTFVKTIVWEAVQQSQTPHKPQCTQRFAPTPVSWPPSPPMLPSLPGTSPQVGCTLPLTQTVLPDINAAFQQVKIFHCCPVSQLKWQESDAK